VTSPHCDSSTGATVDAIAKHRSAARIGIEAAGLDRWADFFAKRKKATDKKPFLPSPEEHMKAAAYLALVALISAVASPAVAAGKTAKALLPLAMTEAKKWQPDAALVYLETKSAEPDGTVPVKPFPGTWVFIFISPKTKQKVGVMVDGNGKVARIDTAFYKNDAAGEFTVDSDKAVLEAIKNGLKTNDYGMSMSLEKNAGRTEWQMLDKTHFYYVDANSGRFLRKEKN
jgi:hypothetical protein